MVWDFSSAYSMKAQKYEPDVKARLGVKTRVFHLGDYRRAKLGLGQEPPDDYFFVNG